MKTLYKAWLFLLAICSTWIAQAAPVDSLTVSKVATVYLSQYVDRFEGLECVVKRTSADGTPLYYIFNHKNNNGFIIVIADDACFPILGYATTGRFAPDNVPPQLDKMLFHRAAEISFIKREKLTANDEINQFWQRLKNPPATARIGKVEAVGPLLTTTWNQRPYYNDLCPADAKGNKAVTGCVATAMAQIMRYHKYPKTGIGFHTDTTQNFGLRPANFGATTYNWDSMPDSLTKQSPISAIAAVATLMYHCGVSVDMNYGVNTSGIPSTSIMPDVYKKYFGYATSVKYVQKKDYSESAWIATLKAELDAKRPIEYGGIGSGGGHEFVCDGYNNNDLFHFNWGWGGQSNSYFYINKLNPGSLGTGGGDGGYNNNQDAVIGIQPAIAANSSFDLQLTKKLIINPNPMTFGNDVTVSFNIINEGKATFQGDYCVALFSTEGDFISYIGSTQTTSGLPAGYSYNSDLTFTQKTLFVSEGDYQIAAYYRESQKEWKALGSTKFQNLVQVSAKGVVRDLKMVGVPLQTSITPIAQKTPFTVSCNIKNFGTTTFEGDLSMDLQALDGKVVATLEIKNNITLSANSAYPSVLVFRTTGLNVPVGTYFISPGYKRKNETTYYYPSAYKDNTGTYPNLIRVDVVAPVLVADRFEPNDKEIQAATLPLSFVNNIATSTTESSNLHIDSDIDYYKLDLPSGYTYEVTARVHDKGNSGNGKKYDANVLFSYKAGNNAYSDVFDVSINDNKVNLQEGNTLIFKVGPYFASEVGTYLLDIQVTRKQIVLGIEDDISQQLTVYPNPTTGLLTVQTPQPFKFHSVNVLNVLGQKVIELPHKQTIDKLPIDLSRYPAGMYYLQITGETETITRKISLIK